MKLLGLDTGGTFTDFVYFDGERLRVHKVLSTPQAPEQAILQGIAELGLNPEGLRLVHGTTVATNAVLEGKGVRTLYIGNRGFADLLAIGRQARKHLYRLQPPVESPPLPSELCLETGGRLNARGEEVESLTQADLDRLGAEIRSLAPSAVAINLLFSYLDDNYERAIEAIIPKDIFVSRSSRVLPEIREYERGLATWLNAWVGPLLRGYLDRLAASLPGARVAVMQSSGDTVLARQAGDMAVRMLLSGPAGGLVGARYLGKLSGRSRLLSFDMGGTSTDVALLDGEPRLTDEGRIGSYPVAVPMVDMHTIGAGGGSIARLDSGGLLQVGPESAGALPGPACYGRGGREATVSDANLLLGRLQADRFLGGRMPLDPGAARQVIQPLAEAMGASLEEAALGILQVANEHMARALRVISVQRGVDPRPFTLLSFGGAGGLHVCALARALGLRQAMVPAQAGVLSALGMLVTRPGRQLSHTWGVPLRQVGVEEVNARLQSLMATGWPSLIEEGVPSAEIVPEFALDLCYLGQSYSLTIPWRDNIDQAAEAFAREHQGRYGHRLNQVVEIRHLRVALRSTFIPQVMYPLPPAPPGTPLGEVDLHGYRRVALWRSDDLAPGQGFDGPALLVEDLATTWVEPGWRGTRDEYGHLLLELVGNEG